MLSLSLPISLQTNTFSLVKQHKPFSTVTHSKAYRKRTESDVKHIFSSYPKVPRVKATSSNLAIEGSDELSITEKILQGGLQLELMPKHVAIIMDGNRRWASEKGLPVEEGYRNGGKALKEIVRLCCEWGIKALTIFAFSTENWVRPKDEVDILMSLFEEVAATEVGEAMRFGIRGSVIGDISKFPKSLKKLISLGVRTTKANKGLHLNIALNYGGRYDILRATKKIASKVKDGHLQLEDIDEKLFAEELNTKHIEFPDPDLLIRTSGELRVSNFMLWELAYTELFFVEKMFPDFEQADFIEALSSFQHRQRVTVYRSKK